jgi:5-bromo-4-chloroindolyl phosphate hydrolysis protein
MRNRCPCIEKTRNQNNINSQEEKSMSMLISGIVSVVLGIIGFSLWWSAFVIALKGIIPILLILGGILAVYIGLDSMEDRAREERKKQEEKIQKTRDEMDQIRLQAEQYREELDRLKGTIEKKRALTDNQRPSSP